MKFQNPRGLSEKFPFFSFSSSFSQKDGRHRRPSHLLLACSRSKIRTPEETTASHPPSTRLSLLSLPSSHKKSRGNSNPSSVRPSSSPSHRRHTTPRRALSPCLIAPPRAPLLPSASLLCCDGQNHGNAIGVPNAVRRHRRACCHLRPPRDEPAALRAPPQPPNPPRRVSRAGTLGNEQIERVFPDPDRHRRARFRGPRPPLSSLTTSTCSW